MKTDRTSPLLPMRCNVSGITVYTRSGVKVVRKSHNEKSEAKSSLEQLCQRIRFANCINLWRSFEGESRPTYELRKPGQSDYNCFIQTNVKRCDRYLTREVLEQQGCVPFQMILSLGTLSPVELERVGGLLVTSLQVGGLAIDDSTSLGQIWDAVIDNNKGFYRSRSMNFFFIRYDCYDPEIPRMDGYTATFVMNPHEDTTSIALNNALIPLPQFFAVAEHGGANRLAFRPLDGTRARYDGIAAFQSQHGGCCSTSVVEYIHPSDVGSSYGEMLQAVESYGGVRKTDPIEIDRDHNDLKSDFADHQ